MSRRKRGRKSKADHTKKRRVQPRIDISFAKSTNNASNATSSSSIGVATNDSTNDTIGANTSKSNSNNYIMNTKFDSTDSSFADLVLNSINIDANVPSENTAGTIFSPTVDGGVTNTKEKFMSKSMQPINGEFVCGDSCYKSAKMMRGYGLLVMQQVGLKTGNVQELLPHFAAFLRTYLMFGFVEPRILWTDICCAPTGDPVPPPELSSMLNQN